MKFRSLVLAGTAIAALGMAPASQASGTSNDTVNATVVSGELTLSPSVTTPMVIARGGSAVDGVTTLLATSTNATFGVTAAVTSGVASEDGKMHQCSVAGAFTGGGKTLTNALEFAQNSNLGTLAGAATSAFGTGSNTIISGGVGAATKFLKWHQTLDAADAVLSTENYCFKVTYTIT